MQDSPTSLNDDEEIGITKEELPEVVKHTVKMIMSISPVWPMVVTSTHVGKSFPPKSRIHTEDGENY